MPFLEMSIDKPRDRPIEIMDSCTLIAPAKINLYLEIIGDRPDGFHELAMVMQSITLADRIELRANRTPIIRLDCNSPDIPADSSNLAHRAAALMAERFPERYHQFGGVDISIDKRIPVAAGLAGGSSNAAAVLVGLDLLWDLGLTQSELQDLGAMLGSDIPFCISGGTALVTGRGEHISPLPSLEGLYLVLGKYRSLQVSTAWAYKTYRQQFGSEYVSDATGLEERRQRVHSGSMVSAIARQDGTQIGKLLYNDLQKVVLPNYPQVAKLRDALAESGGLGAMMSGSGPSVFALYASAAQAQEIYAKVRSDFPDPDLELWVTQLNPNGIEVN
jgi:4-diphosphocytidyl-2-C-methyl-D-erythritol kinase